MRPVSPNTDQGKSRSNIVTPTTAESFRDGTMLELVRLQGESRLLMWRNNRSRLLRRLELGNQTYEPMLLDPTTVAAVRFPGGTARYSSVQDLFRRVLDALSRYSGLPSRELRLVPYWLLASWFPELLPVLPTLVVTGPSSAEARKFLRLLRCLCRRGVLLTEVSAGGFLALPMHLRPTILLEQARLGRQTRGLLRAATYVPKAGEFLDLRCTKAVYCEQDDLDAELREGLLTVSLFPAAAGVPAFNTSDEEKLAAELQPRLLQYRCKNFRAVRKCNFDAPGFTTGVRDLARSLGAAVVGDSVLTSEIISLLSARDDDVRASWDTLPDVAISVSLLAFVHEKQEPRMPVSKLTGFVNATLRSRGEIKEYNPIEIGRILSRLSLPRARNAGGMVVEATREVSRRVHELQRRYGVTISPASYPGCPDCGPVEAPGDRLLV